MTRQSSHTDNIRVWYSRMFMYGVCVLCCAALWWQHPPAAPPPLPVTAPAVWSRPTRVPATRPSRRTARRPTDAVLCLAQTLYFEANGESYEGLQAVAATVFNRMRDDAYPNTVCGVVYQPYQYSWTSNRIRWSRRPPHTFVRAAEEFIHQRVRLRVMFPVTHFHHVAVTPAWSKTLTPIMTVGQHRFYGQV